MKIYLFIFCVLLGFPLWAQDDAKKAYLREMPTAERVILEIKGSNVVDTVAKQIAAFSHLQNVITTMTRGGRQFHWEPLSPPEDNLSKAYGTPKTEKLQGGDLRNMRSLLVQYKSDERFRQELFEHFFSQEWRESFATTESLAKAEKDRIEQERVKEREFEVEREALEQRRATLDRLTKPVAITLLIGIFGAYFLIIRSVLKGNPSVSQVVHGRIETLGQSMLFMEQGTRYSIIKFRTSQGKTLTLTSVVVANDLESELFLGAEGVFAFYNAQNDCIVLCGCRIGGRTIVGDKNLDVVVRVTKSSRSAGIIHQIGGIVFIPLCGVGFYFMAIGWKYLLNGVSRRPSQDQIISALASVPICEHTEQR